MSSITAEKTDVIVLTEAAAEKLATVMKEKGLADTYGLRVFVSGGGCSGLQYGMTFDANPRPTDTVFDQRGLRLIIDPQSVQYMAGSEIDFLESPISGGFHIENPNAVASCSSCGSSSRSGNSGGCSGCG